MIIALTGPMGSGKSTVFNMLQKLMYFKCVKFAGPLYEMQEAIYKIARRKVPTPKDRKLLQWLGTEWGRSIDENMWVDLWKYRAGYTQAHGVSVFCDDCRFDNEAETIKSMGGFIVEIVCPEEIRATRIQLEGTAHASEKGISKEYIDYRLMNAGGLEDLETQVKEMYATLSGKSSSAAGRPGGQHEGK